MKKSNLILIPTGIFSFLMGGILSWEFGFLSAKFNILGIIYIISVFLGIEIGLNLERQSRTKKRSKK